MCHAAMDFHHLDPNSKDFGLSTWDKAMGNERIAREAAKCACLCCRCHTELHSGCWSTDDHRMPGFNRAVYDAHLRDSEQRRDDRKNLVDQERSVMLRGRGRKVGDWANVDAVAARDAGASWKEIGTRAGVSGSAAKKHYERVLARSTKVVHSSDTGTVAGATPVAPIWETEGVGKERRYVKRVRSYRGDHGVVVERTRYPADAVVKKQIWLRPLRDLARAFGVTETALKKHCKKRKIGTPPRGYWQKLRAKK